MSNLFFALYSIPYTCLSGSPMCSVVSEVDDSSSTPTQIYIEMRERIDKYRHSLRSRLTAEGNISALGLPGRPGGRLSSGQPGARTWSQDLKHFKWNHFWHILWCNWSFHEYVSNISYIYIIYISFILIQCI